MYPLPNQPTGGRNDSLWKGSQIPCPTLSLLLLHWSATPLTPTSSSDYTCHFKKLEDRAPLDVSFEWIISTTYDNLPGISELDPLTMSKNLRVLLGAPQASHFLLNTCTKGVRSEFCNNVKGRST